MVRTETGISFLIFMSKKILADSSKSMTNIFLSPTFSSICCLDNIGFLSGQIWGIRIDCLVSRKKPSHFTHILSIESLWANGKFSVFGTTIDTERGSMEHSFPGHMYSILCSNRKSFPMFSGMGKIMLLESVKLWNLTESPGILCVEKIVNFDALYKGSPFHYWPISVLDTEFLGWAFLSLGISIKVQRITQDIRLRGYLCINILFPIL